MNTVKKKIDLSAVIPTVGEKSLNKLIEDLKFWYCDSKRNNFDISSKNKKNIK